MGAAAYRSAARRGSRHGLRLYPIVHALEGPDERGAGPGEGGGDGGKWNRGFFACAEAVLAGRAPPRRSDGTRG